MKRFLLTAGLAVLALVTLPVVMTILAVYGALVGFASGLSQGIASVAMPTLVAIVGVWEK